MILTYFSCPCVLSSHSESWLTCMINRILLKCQCTTSEARSYITLKLPVFFLLNHLLWGKPPFMSLGEVHEAKNYKASCNSQHQLANPLSEPSWKHILYPIQTFRWLQPHLTSCLRSYERR